MKRNPDGGERVSSRLIFWIMASIIVYLLLRLTRRPANQRLPSAKCPRQHPPTIKCPACPKCPSVPPPEETTCPVTMCPTPPACPSPPPCPASSGPPISPQPTSVASSSEFGSLGRNLEF